MRGQQPQGFNAIQREQNRRRNLQRAQNTNDVVPIRTQEEEFMEMDQEESTKTLRYEINIAMLNGQHLNVLLSIKKFYTPGHSTNSKQANFDQWITNFFDQQVKIKIIREHFENRIDSGLVENPGQIFMNIAVVYGVDFLNTDQLVKRFFNFNFQVKWIDSSHCLFRFENSQAFRRFLDYKLRNKSSLANVDVNMPQIYARQWAQIELYTNLGYKRPLYVRNWTQKDNQQSQGRDYKRTLYGNYCAALKKLQTELLQDDRVRAVYQKTLTEDRALKNIGKERKQRYSSGRNQNRMAQRPSEEHSFIDRDDINTGQVPERHSLAYYKFIEPRFHERRPPRKQNSYQARQQEERRQQFKRYQREGQEQRKKKLQQDRKYDKKSMASEHSNRQIIVVEDDEEPLVQNRAVDSMLNQPGQSIQDVSFVEASHMESHNQEPQAQASMNLLEQEGVQNDIPTAVERPEQAPMVQESEKHENKAIISEPVQPSKSSNSEANHDNSLPSIQGISRIIPRPQNIFLKNFKFNGDSFHVSSSDGRSFRRQNPFQSLLQSNSSKSSKQKEPQRRMVSEGDSEIDLLGVPRPKQTVQHSAILSESSSKSMSKDDKSFWESFKIQEQHRLIQRKGDTYIPFEFGNIPKTEGSFRKDKDLRQFKEKKPSETPYKDYDPQKEPTL